MALGDPVDAFKYLQAGFDDRFRRRDEGPDAVAPYNHPIFFQVAQGLAQGRPRDAQALREFNLAWQAITGRVAIALHQILSASLA